MPIDPRKLRSQRLRSVIKVFAVPKEMHMHVGPARVFNFEDEALDALRQRKVTPGDVVIRYEGPRANGMPEMYFASTILASDPTLNTTTALVAWRLWACRASVSQKIR